MGIFPVEFPSTTADGFESFRLLHYLAFIKGRLWGRRKAVSYTHLTLPTNSRV